MANIQDVAKKAGVSISTVSRVMNGTAIVNLEIKKRVEEAIEELDYQPNLAARSLRTNRSRVIGLLVSDIQNPFFMELIQGVEDEAQRNEFSVILCNSNEDPRKEQQYLDVLLAERVAGAIIVPTREQLKEHTLKALNARNIPVVAVDRRIKDKSIDAVLVDNLRGSSEAVTHLIDNGYRRIGVITGPKSITTGRERLEGYRQALIKANIPLDPNLERSGPFNLESGRHFATELLELKPRIDALFVGNNLLTMGALEAIHARKLRIPEDVALVGYDEMQWAALGLISLSTVMQPIRELGSTAALRLFQRLQHSGDQARQEIILTPTLVTRRSSMPRDQASLLLGEAATTNEIVSTLLVNGSK